MHSYRNKAYEAYVIQVLSGCWIGKTRIGGLALLKSNFGLSSVIGHEAGTALPTIAQDPIEICILFSR